MRKTIPKYIHDEQTHNMNDAREIVPHVVKLINPKSVVDIGCGIGTFLRSFKEAGVEKILGIDGTWVDKNILHKYINHNEFIELDLEKPIKLNQTFNLVVCLEVVEHLSPHAADIIIQSLVSAGKIILFSAAIPNQGGQNHINEQWLTYWEEKFNAHNYILHDVLRPIFWNNPNIVTWYKQNIVLIAHKDMELNLQLPYNPIRNIIHPLYFQEALDRNRKWDNFIKLSKKEKFKKILSFLNNRLNKIFRNY